MIGGLAFGLSQNTFAPESESPKCRLHEELAKLANLKIDKVANFDEVKPAQERITHDLKRNGYLEAKTEVKRAVNDSARVDFKLSKTPSSLTRTRK